MRKDAVQLEEGRLNTISDLDEYPWFKERHRVFPAVFENRQHKRILDLAAGVGCVSNRVHSQYSAELVSSDISPTCLKILGKLGVPIVAFDIDDYNASFPIKSGNFDAVISMVTIEHVLNLAHFMEEISRILKTEGFLYISTPNYAAPEYLAAPLFSGRTFHDPMSTDESKYEFFAHVRYFTYRTLLEYVSSFGFVPDTVYLALPGGSARYQDLYAKSKLKALSYRYLRWSMFKILSPRWATEPIICFQKTSTRSKRVLRKIVL